MPSEPFRCRRFWPVIGEILDNSVPWPTIGAIDKRVFEPAVRWILHLFEAIGTHAYIRGYQGGPGLCIPALNNCETGQVQRVCIR